MECGADKRFADHPAFKDIITRDARLHSLFQHIESISESAKPVLITGETGVGKELFAKAVHNRRRLEGRLVSVNVAGLDDTFLSDTLFGHVKGAFSGAAQSRSGLIEQAKNGTLFLDEIGDLSLTSQTKLLRLIQEGEYFPIGSDRCKKTNAVIVTATNADLWELQRVGRFREDLNFRIRTHHIHIPPLRRRPGDIPLLVDHFLETTARALNKSKPSPTDELFPLLKTYSFPGNVRELQTMIHDAVSRHSANVLPLDVFLSHIRKTNRCLLAHGSDSGDCGLFRHMEHLPTIQDVTEMLIEEAMRRTHGNQTAASKMIGISQPALSKRLKRMSPGSNNSTNSAAFAN